MVMNFPKNSSFFTHIFVIYISCNICNKTILVVQFLSFVGDEFFKKSFLFHTHICDRYIYPIFTHIEIHLHMEGYLEF